MSEIIDGSEEQDKKPIGEEGKTWDNPGEFEPFDKEKAESLKDDNDEAAEGGATEDVEEENRSVELKRKIDEARGRLERLRNAEVPEGKFKFPEEVFDSPQKLLDFAEKALGTIDASRKRSEYRTMGETTAEENVFRAGARMDYIEKYDGKINKALGERLWSLYKDPDILLTVHTSKVEEGSDHGEVGGSAMTDGLGLESPISYADVQRGEGESTGIEFIDIVDSLFDHNPDQPGKGAPVKRWVKTGFLGLRREVRDVPGHLYRELIAVPKNFLLSSDNSFGEPLFGYQKRVRVTRVDESGIPYEKQLRPLNPRYIVGIAKDGALNEMAMNPNFSTEALRKESKMKKIGSVLWGLVRR